MEEQNVKKSIFSPNKIVAIIIYALILFVLAGFITIGLATIIGMNRNLSTTTILESLTSPDLTKYSQEYIEVNALAQGWGNFLGYLLACIGVLFFMRDDIVIDFRSMREEKKFYASYIPLAALAFVGITYIVDLIFSVMVDSSVNQATIEAIILNGGAIPMVLATVLLAPVVEEFIYRKAIFSICQRYGIVACYVISTLFFTLPHMLSSDMTNIGIWLLQCMPYVISGVLLCVVYHKSKYNVYASIAAHMANNLLAGISILFLQSQ